MSEPLLYEINTRCWLRELSQRAGRTVTLAEVPEEEFATWQRLGFTHIWLMGVWTSGPRSRGKALEERCLRKVYDEVLPGWREEDVGGSPYAILAYRVLPALGGEEGLQAFRRRLHAHGLRLLLDFVPNHVALDHPWLQERPELLVQSPIDAPGTFPQPARNGTRWFAFGRDPYCPPWTDTIQLDYRQAALRTAMAGQLLSVADRCDGVRCDMAMLVLNDVFAKTWEHFPRVDSASRSTNFRKETAHSTSQRPKPDEPPRHFSLSSPGGEGRGEEARRSQPPDVSSCSSDFREFWAEAISAVRKAHPDFLFMAEVYWGLGPRLRELGFDYTYDKDLYDRLMAHDGPGVQTHLLGLPPGAVAGDAHFLENHDEPRVAAHLSPAEERAAALLILGLPGLRFLHDGQLTGARVRTPVQLLRRQLEPPRPEIKKFYEQILTTLPSTAVGQGKAELIAPRRAWLENPTAENFVLIQWQNKPEQFALVVVNLAPHRSQCNAPLRVPQLSTRNWSMKDLLGEEHYLRSGKELQTQGLYLDLPPHGAQLFHFEPAL